MGGWNLEPVNYDHVDFKHDWIERAIKMVVEAMSLHGVQEEDIIQKLQGWQGLWMKGDDIFLIMQAAKLLYNDRVNAPEKKVLFKRVP